MSNEKTNDTETTASETASAQTVQVMTRFERKELDEMKDETGATADATAVACFCRKHLRKRS
jgi:hypothetical protein